MQKVKIPITLHPGKAAQHRLKYDGIVPLEKLVRLREVVQEEVGEIAVTIHCKNDEQGLVVISGNLSTHVTVTCQRCNGDLGLDLVQDFVYSPVAEDTELDNFPEDYDEVAVDENGEINVFDLIEDELILAVPLVATHNEASCSYSAKPASFGVLKAKEDKPNPFDILKQLKKDS
ncbi:23S rRNA accumulation protein YceD [Pseudoalteromonas prydzensis]|uniref:23S rRNA accumulation protein YceD n=1 Tax=Pseudoalteromonas prydzensis TaxID=182141 RepID=UPI003704D353